EVRGHRARVCPRLAHAGNRSELGHRIRHVACEFRPSSTGFCEDPFPPCPGVGIGPVNEDQLLLDCSPSPARVRASCGGSPDPARTHGSPPYTRWPARELRAARRPPAVSPKKPEPSMGMIRLSAIAHRIAPQIRPFMIAGPGNRAERNPKPSGKRTTPLKTW